MISKEIFFLLFFVSGFLCRFSVGDFTHQFVQGRARASKRPLLDPCCTWHRYCSDRDVRRQERIMQRTAGQTISSHTPMSGSGDFILRLRYENTNESAKH